MRLGMVTINLPCPEQALLGIATPPALDLAETLPKGAVLRCDFDRRGAEIQWMGTV